MKNLFLLGAVATLTACVTINIYFPAAATEKAADTIIKEIQQQTPIKPPEPKAEAPRSSKLSYLDMVVSPARADDADLDLDNSEIHVHRVAMQNRFPSLAPLYQQGYIGIQQDGLLAVRNASSIPLKDRNKIAQLVSAENADREGLYQDIAAANGHPEWYSQIKITFASRWIDNAQSGWWYQNSSNNWTQK